MLDEDMVRRISEEKGEPDWMLRLRLRALESFHRMGIPQWLVPRIDVDFDSVEYFKGVGVRAQSWEDIPEDIRKTYDDLGIPEAERKVLAGLSTQYDSEVIYARLKKEWESKGVILMGMDEALRRYPDIVRKHFGRLVSPVDNKFSALHYAVWSGGTFLYVPRGVKVSLPLQTFFRIQGEGVGQFEHTLIVVEEGASVSYIEGCAAPVYSKDNLHSAVVEVFVGPRAHVRFTTIQNWSKNVINLNTKRATVDEGGLMEWISGSLGSRISVLYPSTILRGKGARAEMHSITLSKGGSVKESGAKMIHLAPDTHSNVISKSISLGGGVSVYRGLIRFGEDSRGSSSTVSCDSLIMDDSSEAHTYPEVRVENPDISFNHEARSGRISDDVMFYMNSRGLSEDEATNLFIQGFTSPILKEIPLEYALELNKLLNLEVRGVG